ncbi:FAD-dependent sensor of blue light [Salegentibacter sp. 24]|uniref:BLUF domain-containing protein n=1 Tax=Salegentibacter sp. 24 TaxID=2183986 RepID=UPI00106090A0|nr:BLUF domain-containing protein [Salegentibacter sp. 24]TDN83865.1 FAD-dependent sensor of blue light [Salegentibacter sp. 24]
MRHAICYISNKEESLSFSLVLELLEFSREQNSIHDIKGVLLYSEGNFFQILEGDKKTVLALFEKIKNDPRHYGIIQIIGQDIEQGAIDGFKVDVIKDEEKVTHELPPEYTEALVGIPPQTKSSMENMLRTFIATR